MPGMRGGDSIHQDGEGQVQAGGPCAAYVRAGGWTEYLCDGKRGSLPGPEAGAWRTERNPDRIHQSLCNVSGGGQVQKEMKGAYQ